MKKRFFITTFIIIQLGIITLHIEKQSRLIKLSYEKQKYEKQISQLKIKKQELTCTIASLQNQASIKQYAQNTLGMSPLSLHKIKRVPAHG